MISAREPIMSTTPEISADAIMRIAIGFKSAKVLMSAVELGIFTELARAPLDGETLRRRVGLHERGARDLLDTLVALGLLEREAGIYRNTPETDLFLDAGKPTYVGGALEMLDKRLFANWARLTDALRTGKPQNGGPVGSDPFVETCRDPEALGVFLRGLNGFSLPPARALARRFAWGSYATFIDIGTGGGQLPVEIASAHRHLTGGGLDLGPIGPLFDAFVRERGLSDRLRFHASDFLQEPLPSADVLVMGHILHDWDLATKRMLLAKAHAALPQGGALVVYDQMIDDDRRANTEGLLMSLSMLVQTPGGFDYTAADCLDWIGEAGFAEAHARPLVGPYAMAVGIK
jgi:hypothetical protein